MQFPSVSCSSDPVSTDRFFTTSADGKTYLKIAPGEILQSLSASNEKRTVTNKLQRCTQNKEMGLFGREQLI